MSTTTMPTLTAERRESIGSRSARKARAAGRTPANLYRHGEDNHSVLLDAHGLDMALATPAQVFEIELEGTKYPCLVREVQYDAFGQVVLHVDFARVTLDEEVSVEVPFEIRGTATGVVEGGVLTIQHNALAVLCNADSIPDELRIDVSHLGMAESMFAGDIALPPGVRLDTDTMLADLPVITVVPPRVLKKTKKELAAEAEAAEAEGEGAEGEGTEGEGAESAEGDSPADDEQPSDES